MFVLLTGRITLIMYKSNKLIVFFIPPKKDVNGGIMSIFSICKVSREFKDIHGADVVLSTFPGFESYIKNDLFENDETIYTFDEIVNMGKLESLQIHVPEYASTTVYDGLQAYHDYLDRITNLSVNILNQNILLMQNPVDVAKWFLLTPDVTQTTAHDRYTTQEVANLYDLPTHHFSTFVDAKQYTWVPYDKKQTLIALSPDEAEGKALFIKNLKEKLPKYEIITIKNMRYEEYKRIIGQAKFAITFGEGFDGYYVEAFFSGGITFAVYNEEFFPDKDFDNFDNTFSSLASLQKNLIDRINILENKELYEKIVKQNLDKINQLYSYASYKKKVKNYYLKSYDYLPERGSAERLIGQLMKLQLAALAKNETSINERDLTIARLKEIIKGDNLAFEDLNNKFIDIVNSESWKITKPLRELSSILRKFRDYFT